jgi:pSer/pThr/pTyr-binding forkhead associated (FHA) protein
VRLRFRIRPPVTAQGSAVERTVEVDATRTVLALGREAGSDIELPFNTVSSRHARLTRVGDGWTVVDLGSANGTFLGGLRLAAAEPRPVGPGQGLRLADVEVIFEGPASPEQAAPPESTATLARRLVNDLFGSCRPAEVPRLVVDGGPEAGKELLLEEAGRAYQVGRASGCDLVLVDDDVSREHASFERRWNGVEVRDLDSKNGVEIDGERIVGVRRLRDGQKVVVGNTRLRLEDPEDRYLIQMQEEAARPGTTLVSAQPASAAGSERPPAARRRATTGPVAIAAVALAVLAGIGGLVLWLLVGG